MGRPLIFVLSTLLIYSGLAVTAQQPDLTKIGPAVGARVPEFSGLDQFGKTQTLQTAAGASGTMLVFFRSADW